MDLINSKQSFILLVSNFLKLSLPLRTAQLSLPLDFGKAFSVDTPSLPSVIQSLIFVKYTTLAREPETTQLHFKAIGSWGRSRTFLFITNEQKHDKNNQYWTHNNYPIFLNTIKMIGKANVFPFLMSKLNQQLMVKMKDNPVPTWFQLIKLKSWRHTAGQWSKELTTKNKIMYLLQCKQGSINNQRHTTCQAWYHMP